MGWIQPGDDSPSPQRRRADAPVSDRQSVSRGCGQGWLHRAGQGEQMECLQEGESACVPDGGGAPISDGAVR